jgi:hypothetical protein
MNYPFHYTRFIFIPVALVGSLFASSVLAQEATSTEHGSSTQTVETIADAASEKAPSDSATVENAATSQSSPTPEPGATPQAGVTPPAADQTHETVTADESTSPPANLVESSITEDTPELVQPIESGDSDHVVTASGIMIKYYVECDHLYAADIMGTTSAPALCHDDLGKKYEMLISPEENARLADGGKLYKQILMTVDYAHQNAIKKITDAGGTEADIPMSLFYDPTVQAAETAPQATTTQDTSENDSESQQVSALSPGVNTAENLTDSSGPVEATTSVPADVPAPAPTVDEQDPAAKDPSSPTTSISADASASTSSTDTSTTEPTQ